MNCTSEGFRTKSEAQNALTRATEKFKREGRINGWNLLGCMLAESAVDFTFGFLDGTRPHQKPATGGGNQQYPHPR